MNHSILYQDFVVQTFSKKGILLKAEIWNSTKPLRVGFPVAWVLENEQGQVFLRNLDKPSLRKSLKGRLLEDTHAIGESLKIKVQAVRKLELELPWASTHTAAENLVPSKEAQVFKKYLQASLMGIALLIVSSIALSPYFISKEEPLIPPQYAKLIFTPRNRSSGETKSTERPNLVKAFQSKEVQKSAQKLLTGGVLSLLAKSDLVSGRTSRSAVHALFEPGQKNTNALAALAGSRPLLIAALGGTGGGGSGIGYGKGQKAGVLGQGTSFVSMDAVDAKVEEGLTKDEVGQVIHSHVAEIRYCYESSMLKNPSIQGKMVVDFSIQFSGTVKTAKINSSNVSDSSLDACIIRHLTQWKFPKPRGSIDVAVTYPFIFKALGR